MEFVQEYVPLGNVYVSAVIAGIPIFVILTMLGLLRTAAHWAALAGLTSAVLVALFFYGMPAPLVASSAAYGAVFGLWPIAWIVLNAIFLHNLTVETGKFDIVREALASLTTDRRIQALIIAFAFGALIEGIAGFGAPVAITAAILASLGFAPLYAASIALLANTAPVAFGSLGVPVITLGGLVAPIVGNPDVNEVTNALSAMVGRQLPLFSLIIPGFMIFVMAGWRGMVQVMPAVLTAGISFAVTQFLVSNFLGPALVDVLAALVALAALYLLLRVWQPETAWRFPNEEEESEQREGATGRPAPVSGIVAGRTANPNGSTLSGFMPYIILVAVIVIARIGTIFPNLPPALNVTELLGRATVEIPWPGLDGLVQRVPPITAAQEPYAAVYTWEILATAGTVVLFAAIIAGVVMGASLATMVRVYGRSINQLKLAILTIALILALAFVMNYSGATSTLGLAFAGTGLLFPFFSAFIGWLGVFLSGSDTSANSLFGPMQTITAQQVGVEPALAGATNSSGGVMGKMISPQNLAVGASAIGQVGQEANILRMTIKWSLILTTAMGLLAMFQAYVIPWIIPSLN
ncbi:lctP: transporter, lactate permease (LctP) family [Rubrobacter radiotolerans]|uniref:L-lactate permease n=1 Tax=Rubrobacter radiotolerans TaxID=42256 RepID=A0A023X5G9_RUBRA|nr:lactate permease LctP family transporter [Rubrobacter radiotolerans]AHY47548.1 lctP: transporter, lactate permease (LctP) family [Rubrobacter radiotolerans]MDX5894951.1 lactate permease LctP family transporter [Rubrobacter radiotolerans]SMC07139.1 lactate permease [Rubrobacter radiotolerans DSM 5868]